MTSAGDVVRFRVLHHAPWGIAGEIVGSEKTPASIDFHQIGLRDWTDEDYPPIGSVIDAAVMQQRDTGRRLSHLDWHRKFAQTTGNSPWVDRGIDRPRTHAEHEFLSALLPQIHLHIWLHQDPDGSPWLIASCDLHGHRGSATLRLDFDGTSILGGWSPSGLNWDDGVRGRDAGLGGDSADEIFLQDPDPAVLASNAAAWFSRRISIWLDGSASDDGGSTEA